MEYHLITTADERTWKFDRPVLFLGEWCQLYNRRDIWSKMDSVVAGPFGIAIDEKNKNLAYIENLIDQLVEELTSSLNEFHNTTHSPRYWRILLGHWLQRYVEVLFNRYFTVEHVVKNYEISGTTIFDNPDYCFAVTDSSVFFNVCRDEIWNHYLYARILEFVGRVPVSKIRYVDKELNGFTSKPTKPTRRKWKSFIFDFTKWLLGLTSSSKDALLISTYLPRKEELKLYLHLGQFPQLRRSPALIPVAFSRKERDEFKLDTKKHIGFEYFIRQQLTDFIPVSFLEGYESLVKQSKQLPWPSKPRFIFTSNNFDMDEIFKEWAASKVAEGYPYYVGQHGNHYGTLNGHARWPELVTPDKFLTWGWTNDNPKNKSAFIFKNIGRKPSTYLPDGGLLLIEITYIYRMSHWDDYFEHGVYQKDQFAFVSSLPLSVQKRLTVRLYGDHKNHCWFDQQRWKDFNPLIEIEPGICQLKQLVEKSRLIVHSYDSTGVLETLALNIPTITFWQGGLDHLVPRAKPFYHLLRKAGIIAESPEEAAAFIGVHWDNIGKWWYSAEVQEARVTFCNEYARTVEQPLKTLKNLLIDHEK